MKYIVILGDGMADLPSDALGGMTPLEVAYKPNIDSLAQKAICGMCKTVPDGIKPGSDVANLSVMGYSPLKYYSGRSPLEALSIGVDMADSDLAVRCNLVTLSEEDNYAEKSMVDYSAGEISTEEAAELISFVQNALGDDEFAFYSGVSYRHCLIKHNGERGTEYTPPHDISGKVIGEYLPKGLYGDKMLDLMIKSYDILKDHPINLKRIADGKNPANSIWLWGEGSRPSLPDFESLRGLKGAVISAVDLLKGIGIASGMEIIEVDGVTGTVNTNFSGKAEACVKAIRDGFDYVYLHMEAPDECGHQGDSKGKVKSIELIDEKVVGYILKELADEDLRILVCPDHPTPLITKTHSSEPIPFIIYDSTCIKQGVSAYTESECAKTGIMLNSGEELVEMFLQKENDMQENDNKEDLVSDENSIVEQDQNVVSEEVDTIDLDEIEEINDTIAEQQDNADDDEVTNAPSDIVIVDDSNAENNVKIDTNEQNSEEVIDNKEKNSKKKGADKNGKMSPKKKKFLTILISVAVLAVIILVSVLTPILVINAPKILICRAEDFARP
ncbi:MAG: cofactor-independent phosphoglycerate mutase [Clostridia bacterium]|nr:cofactor-independent phosphoglycerate mutase [Clostridia bacterium]